MKNGDVGARGTPAAGGRRDTRHLGAVGERIRSPPCPCGAGDPQGLRAPGGVWAAGGASRRASAAGERRGEPTVGAPPEPPGSACG